MRTDRYKLEMLDPETGTTVIIESDIPEKIDWLEAFLYTRGFVYIVTARIK
jgi:hypothetical protein